MTLCRELTKKHETAFASTIEDILKFYETQESSDEEIIEVDLSEEESTL